ncbi:MAG: hypothetical protein SFZ24_03990 [Planctomycetota bacterium]|nr:hypothetical protein [Planctomycetota bacterium]
MEIVRRAFDASGFPPRWHCGVWSAELGWLHIISDLLIFVAYSAIPLGLAVVLIRRRDLPFPWLVALFVSFILSCGVTHAVDALMFEWPIYRFLGLMKLLTAAVSLTTAAVLVRTLPFVLSLPSIQKANEELAEAIDRERLLRGELEQARTEVEARSTQLTVRNRRFATALAAARVVALQWDVPTGQVVWELGYGNLAQRLGLEKNALRSWSDLLDAQHVEQLRALCERAVSAGVEAVDFEAPIVGQRGVTLRMSAAVEPQVKGESLSMVGMLRVLDGGALTLPA